MREQIPEKSRNWKCFIALGLLAVIAFASAYGQETKNPKQSRTPVTPKTVINLWPGIAPGSEQWKQPETTLGSGDMEQVVNVSTPTRKTSDQWIDEFYFWLEAQGLTRPPKWPAAYGRRNHATART
jgi:hypothetical protein